VLKKGAGTIEKITAHLRAIGAQLIPVVLNPKFSMGGLSSENHLVIERGTGTIEKKLQHNCFPLL